MEKSECWILESVVRAKRLLRVLESPNLEEIVNGPSHGLSHDQLVRALVRLFERRWLFAESIDQGRGRFIPSVSEVEIGLSRTERLYYGLTSTGGAAWEEWAHPNWQLFLDVKYGIDPYVGEIKGANRAIIEQYIEAHQYVAPELIETGSEEWFALSPWNATYWREFPTGYGVRFRYRRNEMCAVRPKAPLGIAAWLEELNHWFKKCPT